MIEFSRSGWLKYRVGGRVRCSFCGEMSAEKGCDTDICRSANPAGNARVVVLLLVHLISRIFSRIQTSVCVKTSVCHVRERSARPVVPYIDQHHRSISIATFPYYEHAVVLFLPFCYVGFWYIAPSCSGNIPTTQFRSIFSHIWCYVPCSAVRRPRNTIWFMFCLVHVSYYR